MVEGMVMVGTMKEKMLMMEEEAEKNMVMQVMVAMRGTEVGIVAMAQGMLRSQLSD